MNFPAPPSSPPRCEDHSPFIATPAAGLERQWVADPDDLPEVVLQQGQSYYHHEDEKHERSRTFDTMAVGPGQEVDLGGWRGFVTRFRQRRCPIIGIVIFIIVIAGIVVGGYFGNSLAKNKSQDTSPSPDNHNIVPGNGTHLATAIAGKTMSTFRIVLFQDLDGCLSAVEWRGSKSDTYLLRDRFWSYTGSKIPEPIDTTPLSVMRFGNSGDVHVFYIDNRLRFAHIVRRAFRTGEYSWEVGSLSVGGGQVNEGFAPSPKLQLAGTILFAEDTGMPEDNMVVMYHTDADVDSVALLSSTNPDDAASWKSNSFSLGASRLGMQPHPNSNGFLVLPVTRTGENRKKNETLPGVRVVWDLENESHKTTFGMLDCTFTEEQTLENCVKVQNDWQDAEAEQRILDAQKPLRFSSMPLESDTLNSTEYLMRVLDSGGGMTELLWNTTQWTGHQSFSIDTESLPPGITANLTGVATADDGLLFATADGELLELGRDGAWWDKQDGVSGWKFIDVVELDA